MLKTIALKSLQSALNRYLQLDSDSRHRLSQLAGKVLAIDLTDFKVKFFMIFTPEELHLQSTCLGQPDISLQTTILGLAKLATSKNDVVNFTELQMHGDIETAQKISDFFQTLDIDWEEHLSHVTGDIVAHEFGKLARASLRWGKSAVNNFKADMREYLQEEAALLPPAEAMEDYFEDIDTFRHDVERLAVRIQRLQYIIHREKNS